jgi:hypothetical protein
MNPHQLAAGDDVEGEEHEEGDAEKDEDTGHQPAEYRRPYALRTITNSCVSTSIGMTCVSRLSNC